MLALCKVEKPYFRCSFKNWSLWKKWRAQISKVFKFFFTEIPRFVFLRLADLWRTRYVYNVKPISLSSTKKRFQRNLIVNNLQSQIYRFKKIMVENINNTCCKWNIELFVIIELSLREKCPTTEIFLVRISRTRTEYGEMRSISPYSVRMRENTDQKNSVFGHFHAVSFGG